MTGTKDKLVEMLLTMGSTVVVHREEGGTACPCLTYEGFRDQTWHLDHPLDVVCNEQGYLTDPVEYTIKATVQPVRMRYNRPGQRINDLLGEVESDDRIGIFPCRWEGRIVDLDNWSDAGEDYILYDGKRYTIVSSDKVPDIDGAPDHHWELGLRLIKNDRPTDAN